MWQSLTNHNLLVNTALHNSGTAFITRRSRFRSSGTACLLLGTIASNTIIFTDIIFVSGGRQRWPMRCTRCQWVRFQRRANCLVILCGNLLLLLLMMLTRSIRSWGGSATNSVALRPEIRIACYTNQADLRRFCSGIFYSNCAESRFFG